MVLGMLNDLVSPIAQVGRSPVPDTDVHHKDRPWIRYDRGALSNEITFVYVVLDYSTRKSYLRQYLVCGVLVFNL